ncbi:MAG: histidine kinase [Hungatella sp.]
MDKLKEQEINIARQNAELLALHSQINSHFLFNALRKHPDAQPLKAGG